MKYPRWFINHERILIFSVTHNKLLRNLILLGD